MAIVAWVVFHAPNIPKLIALMFTAVSAKISKKYPLLIPPETSARSLIGRTGGRP